MEVQRKTFRFPNENRTPGYCDITVEIKERSYNNNTFYYISYKYNFSEKYQIDPFDNFPEFKYHRTGDIVVKNELSEKMIEFLMMDVNILATKTGCTTPLDYKQRIMIALSKFWD